MADLSKIKLNGMEYNFKDTVARDKIKILIINNINWEETSFSYSNLTKEEIIAANNNNNPIFINLNGDLCPTSIMVEDDSIHLYCLYDVCEYIFMLDTDTTGFFEEVHIQNPRNISSFYNDSGYLTSYTETDPTVPSWAKEATKPTYTASEVGALPDTTVIPTKINDLTNKIFGIAWLDNNTTDRYIYCNNINFSRTGDSYFSSPFLFMFKRDTYRVGEVGTLKGTTNFKFYDINTNAITGVTASGFYMIPSTETLKYGVCYIGYLNDGTVDLQPLTTISNVNSLIASAIGDINSFEVSIVASLPTENIDTHTIYFMANNSSGDSIYDEYMYINNNWEKIGSTAVDLSGYLQTTDIADWAKATIKPTYTASEVGALPDTTVIPTKIPKTSNPNSNGYILFSSNNTAEDHLSSTHIKRLSWTYSSSSHRDTLKISGGQTYDGENFIGQLGLGLGNYTTYLIPNNSEQSINLTLPSTTGTLALTSQIPAAQVNSDWNATNGVAQILNKPTIPDVPSWALATNKPTYTASEVGAATSDHTHSYIGIANPTGDGYVNTGINQVSISASTNGGSTINTITLTGTSTTINNIVTPTADGDAANKKYVDDAVAGASAPTVIKFTYDEELDKYTCSHTYTEICNAIDNNQLIIAKAGEQFANSYRDYRESGGTRISFQFNDHSMLFNDTTFDNIRFTELVLSVNSSDTITRSYHNSPAFYEQGSSGISEETDPIFTASPAANITTEKIAAWDAKSDFSGSYNDLSDKPTIPTVPTNISAFTNDSGYLTSFTESDPTVPAWAKAETKPTYTYTEVGAAASSHTHGSITNAGAITSNTALANGDRLVFSDNSDSGLLKRASITIGNSTTQYLANNGTWQTLPTVSVSQTLTSGTEIGSVNNTKLYAPTPYDDTALAARVTALENLEWATYYSGRSNPSSAQGQNGDIYLQY